MFRRSILLSLALLLSLVLQGCLLSVPVFASGPYNGTTGGAGTLAYTTSGKTGFGQEVSLTGTAPFVVVPTGAFESLGASGTIQCWVKGTTISRGIAGYDATNGVIILDTYGGGVRFAIQINSSSFTILSAATVITDGAYHHVAAEWGPGSASTTPSPTTSIYLLVDGVVVASSLNVAGAYTNSSTANNRDIGTTAGNSANVWTGTIDEFAISTIMEYPTTGTYTVPTAPLTAHTGLVALYHMDGNLLDSASGTPAMVAGVPSQTASGDGTATLDAGAPTGGSGTYTYAWYQRSTANDLDANTTVLYTTRTISLTGLPNGVPQRWAVSVSDGTTTVVTDYVFALAQKPLIQISIGDSLTGGANNDALLGGGYEPPAPTVEGNYIQALLGGSRRVIVRNLGYGGTRSDQWRTDSTTAYTQTVPGTYDTVAAGSATTLLNHALAQINADVAAYGAANVYVSFCLGTNDPNTHLGSSDPTGCAADTLANLTNSLTAIKATGVPVVLHDIPWRSGYGNTFNAARNATLDGLVATLGGAPYAYRGDKGGVIAYQQGNMAFYGPPNVGPHDSQQPMNVRGAIWGAAVAKALFGIPASGSGRGGQIRRGR